MEFTGGTCGLSKFPGSRVWMSGPVPRCQRSFYLASGASDRMVVDVAPHNEGLPIR